MSLFPEKVSIEEIELLHLDMDRLTLVRVLEKLQERHLIKELLVGWNVYYKFEHQVFKEYIYDKSLVIQQHFFCLYRSTASSSCLLYNQILMYFNRQNGK